MTPTRGLIIVISGPSGTGKGTIIGELMPMDPRIQYAVSATTREMRYSEAEGVSYYFKTDAEFDALVASGEVLEWDEFCGKRYGTLRSELERRVRAGSDVILDLTVKGALAIKAAFPEDSITVFILPPSIAELENRIRGRKRETEEQLKERVAQAEREIAWLDRFDYVVVSDSIAEAPVRLENIIEAERQKVHRNPDLLALMGFELPAGDNAPDCAETGTNGAADAAKAAANNAVDTNADKPAKPRRRRR